MIHHPELDVQIVHVVPDAWGPYVDIYASLASLSRRRPWTFVRTPDELEYNPVWDDERAVLIYWSMEDVRPKHARKCKVAHVYAEAMDDDLDLMLPNHRRHWQLFKDNYLPLYDAVFAHTPTGNDFIRKHTQAPLAFTMPVGWDAEAMGAPRWQAPKHVPISYHGSLCGRREVYVPFLERHFGVAWMDVTGSFGRGLIGRLDQARLSLYIAHSNVKSFSTWRLWQMASTSCALVVEGDVDTWPAVAGEHYLEVARLNVENIRNTVDHLEDLSRADEVCLRVSDAMHELGRKYTVDYVEDTYILPAAERMMK